MKENMLDVLMYLFEHYYMDDDSELNADRESLQIELLEAGFQPAEINKAFDWLDSLAQLRVSGVPEIHTSHSLRVYTDAEISRLDSECRGFLLFLEQIGILNDASRELVIDRVMALETDEEVDIDQLKWVILMVLFNQPGEEVAYAWLEDLVFDEYSDILH
jgi:Smg protein